MTVKQLIQELEEVSKPNDERIVSFMFETVDDNDISYFTTTKRATLEVRDPNTLLIILG